MDANEKRASRSSSSESSVPTSLSPAALEKEAGREDKLKKLDSKIIKVEAERDPLAHLTPEEAAVIRLQTEAPEVEVSYFKLYRYASTKDVAQVILALFTAICAGA